MLKEYGMAAIACDNQRCRLKRIVVAYLPRPMQFFWPCMAGMGLPDDFIPGRNQVHCHSGAALNDRIKQFGNQVGNRLCTPSICPLLFALVRQRVPPWIACTHDC